MSAGDGRRCRGGGVEPHSGRGAFPPFAAAMAADDGSDRPAKRAHLHGNTAGFDVQAGGSAGRRFRYLGEIFSIEVGAMPRSAKVAACGSTTLSCFIRITW